MTEEEQAFFEERAAIREYMGGMSRKEAEAAAREDVRRFFAPKPTKQDTTSKGVKR